MVRTLTAALLIGGTLATHAAEVALSWQDNSDNETGFKIERATGSGAYAVIATIGANVTSYMDATAANATTYHFRVYAYNSAGDSSYSNVATAVIPATGSNTAPTISNVSNQSINAGTNTGALAFTIGDNETATGSLTVSGASSNTTLVPVSGLVFWGSGASRTITVTPAAGQTGLATITVTVSDGALVAIDSFTITVNAVNTAPTIGSIANRSISEDTSTGPVAFTIGDAQTASGSLSVAGSSSNTALVPNTRISFGGSGANRTITVTPAANKNGSATITVTVSDGVLAANETFTLTVNAVNDVPTISSVANQTINQDSATAPLVFTINDAETAAGSLAVSGASSNTTLVPVSGIEFGGSGAIRTVTVTPAVGKTGSATISLVVSDGAATATETFTVTVVAVAPANTAPTISNISNVTIPENGTTGAVNFTINDDESAAADLVVLSSSSNTTLVPATSVVLGGTGSTRTVTITPAANKNGSATITLTVSDGTLTAVRMFQVTVSAVNNAPTISEISNQSIGQDGSTGPIAFAIGDVETAAASLTLSVTSSNPTLLPDAGITFGGSGANRTITATPDAGRSGTTTITVVVSDGNATSSAVFDFTVTSVAPVDNPPTVTPIPDQAASTDGVLGPVTFSIADNETAAASLTVSGSSSNPALVPNGNILLSGSGASRNLTVVPAAGQSGTATITITVSDGIHTTSTAFTITVAAAPSPGARVLNLSTRVVCRPGQDMLIPGFVISGSTNKRVLLRAVGPTLGGEPFNVPGALPNPRLVLKRWDGENFVDHAANDDWNAATNAAEIRQTAADVFAFPLTEGSADAALLLELAPGRYTVFVDDASDTSGVVIVELYDADATEHGANFVNMSDRGHVGVGAEVMISGFVVSAERPATMLIRAVGPGLAVAPYNVTNTISDPIIDIYRSESDGSDTLVLTHDNWSDGPDAAEVAVIATQVSAFPLPVGSKDAAVVSTLPPGAYTVVVRGVNNATGTALVEVYMVE